MSTLKADIIRRAKSAYQARMDIFKTNGGNVDFIGTYEDPFMQFLWAIRVVSSKHEKYLIQEALIEAGFVDFDEWIEVRRKLSYD
jgi:hypothetical protein